MNRSEMQRILKTAHTIATVGISTKPDKPGHNVPRYLMEHGYHVIPVNPTIDEIFGQKAYPDLLSIPEPVDVVQMFRRAEDVPPIVDQAIQIGAKVVWMQEGIINEAAAQKAEAAGLEVVMDHCMMVEHRRMTERMV